MNTKHLPIPNSKNPAVSGNKKSGKQTDKTLEAAKLTGAAAVGVGATLGVQEIMDHENTPAQPHTAHQAAPQPDSESEVSQVVEEIEEVNPDEVMIDLQPGEIGTAEVSPVEVAQTIVDGPEPITAENVGILTAQTDEPEIIDIEVDGPEVVFEPEPIGMPDPYANNGLDSEDGLLDPFADIEDDLADGADYLDDQDLLDDILNA